MMGIYSVMAQLIFVSAAIPLIYIVRMNQSSLEGSITRYSKKRKSTDAPKTTHPLKNGKKSLPEVFIDLNNHTKKSKLTLEEKHSRAREEGPSYGEVSNFNEGRTLEKSKKMVKKDNILLKNLYNTDIVKKNDENKNILNEYRDQIELLKMDNERLREENERLKSNQEYLHRRLKEEKAEKVRELEQLKMMHSEMEDKIEQYQEKIKNLYEQLIKAKKEKYGYRQQERTDSEEQIVLTTLNSQNNRARIKGDLQSYRQREKYSNYEIEMQKFKRLTSPSSHSRGKTEKNLNRWCEEQRELLRRQEEKGEMAYYRAEKYRESGRNSVLDNGDYRL